MAEIKNKNIKWWIGIISGVVLFTAIGVFAYMKMSFILKGVVIEAKIEREDNLPLVKVVGNAKSASFLSLNGREIFIDKQGNFSEYVSLLPGYSIITIDAKDKLGNNKEKRFEIFYEENNQLVAIN